ncbi:MAG TPA: hypothetical protein HA362_06050 [Nanoarchaeota archaeon]|nr:hypothetical protein [Nanoarchaeota archaeon]
MARRKKLSETAIDVICKTEYNALVEIALKDNVHLGVTTTGSLWAFEKNEGLPGCITYGSSKVLGNYKGFGKDDDKDIAIRLDVIGKSETLQLKVSQIESMTVYKGKKYKL